MKTILISACLLGVACRYDGCSKPLDREVIEALKKKYHLIPICPEIMGGLTTPRLPSEISSNGKVLRCDGTDVTENYSRGAKEALRLAGIFDCHYFLLSVRRFLCRATTMPTTDAESDLFSGAVPIVVAAKSRFAGRRTTAFCSLNTRPISKESSTIATAISSSCTSC